MVAEMVHSAAEQVGADLRRRVLTGELPPGTPLGEVWLAAEYEVSRATAKTAIETLVSSRLLSRQAHRSARTTAIYRGLSDEIRLCMIQVQGATLLEEGAIAQEHELLLELIAQGAEALAVRLLQEHISRSRRLLSARLRAAATGIRGGDRVL